jgi:hypothetical protein
MRPRRSNTLHRAVILGCMLFASARAARGQTGVVVEGAPETILPTGARSVGMGEAVAATAVGVDALWWNPALVARGQREFALNIATGALTPADLFLGVVYPIRHVATIGLSLRYIDEGGQTASISDVETGSFRTEAGILSGTFAAPFGDRLALGLNLKVITLNLATTGRVDQLPAGGYPVTGAIDVGAQYIATKDSTVIVGASVRNIGLPFQVNDAPQADALPGRLDVGVQFMPRIHSYPDLGVALAADGVSRLTGVGAPGVRLGGEVSWMRRYYARAGVVLNEQDKSGPSFGVGLAYLRWRFDFAQTLNSIENGTGERPTYISLRYVF